MSESAPSALNYTRHVFAPMGREVAIRKALKAWFRQNARDLPFRRTHDPYQILVAEVALQQTRVEQGVPFLERFLSTFPAVESLASASEEEVLLAWEGLGYYRRARSLRQAARAIVREHGGKVPADLEDLCKLPGVGPYTAGAVASIAFGIAAPAVDGNAARVLSRLFMIESDGSTASGLQSCRERAQALLDPEDPGSSNQALMELGALVCRPRAPRCGECPVARHCLAYREGQVAQFPRPRAHVQLPEVEVAFALVERKGRVLAVRRGKGGLLAGLWALPGGEVRESESPRQALERQLAACGLSIRTLREVDRRRKVFSSRVWDARVYRCAVEGRARTLEHARWFTAKDRAKVPFVPFQRQLLDGLGR